MNKVLWSLVALIMCCVSTQAKSSKDLSDYVARDAMAVLRINDLAKLNKEIFAISGMPMNVSSLALMQMGNFSGQGFDQTRSVGAVLTGLKPVPSFYFIIPVTDAELFKKSCALPEGASMQIEGQHVLVTLAGKLPLSFDNKLTPNSKTLASLYIDAEQMVSTHKQDIIGGLTMGRMKMSQAMNQANKAETGADPVMLAKLMGTYFDIGQEFIFGLQDLQIDIDSAQGFVELTQQVSFKNKTSFAKFCNNQKNHALLDASKINNGMMQFSGALNYSKALEAFRPFIDKITTQLNDQKIKDFITTSLKDWEKIGTVQGAGALNMNSVTDMSISGFAKVLEGNIDWKALTRKSQNNPMMKEISSTLRQDYKENIAKIDGKSVDSLTQTVPQANGNPDIEQKFYYLFDKASMYFTMGDAYKEAFTNMLQQNEVYTKNTGIMHYVIDYNKFAMMQIPLRLDSLVSVKKDGMISKTSMNLKNITSKMQKFGAQQQQKLQQQQQ